ncbi:cell division ATP-binding protein FtsE [Salinisphaera hydrothermalis]|uniref:Cell division ATP-binding protein FtsE n=1 Tax=Salinisphaera hydrothermalis (strain C41B8) TaxID=1304275 RepID=A0A084IR68_SALHC|nr:cell division ATP-binding protein FtsE [Salinisphaera hydrothermalis]KEZ79202.1 cell division ATPase [Salinisphaera hydrothermalis C41B8]
MTDIVAFDNVVKRYPGGKLALDRVSLRLARGEMAFLTGHSGAGKSTLMKLIGLIERPTRGRVVINGTDLAKVRRAHIPRYRQRVGLIFQNYNLLYDRTVFDNVALPLVIRGIGHTEIARRVRAALDTVGLLSHEKKFPITLSGGEQQRVGIARAVVNRPHLLLADEPTGNLDPDLSADIMRLFTRLNETGTSIMIATHAIDLVEHMGYRRIALDHGHLEAG